MNFLIILHYQYTTMYSLVGRFQFTSIDKAITKLPFLSWNPFTMWQIHKYFIYKEYNMMQSGEVVILLFQKQSPAIDGGMLNVLSEDWFCKVCGCQLVCCHVLQLLLIRFTSQNVCCKSKFTMKHEKKSDWRSDFPRFSYGYWKCICVDSSTESTCPPNCFH